MGRGHRLREYDSELRDVSPLHIATAFVVWELRFKHPVAKLNSLMESISQSLNEDTWLH